jgi:short-subunit dehydrogenase/pimeloyl-ACP methyl ester carboxylesterase
VIDGAVNGTISSGGVELAFVEAGDPARPTIVFVHGYPDTKALWDGVLAALAGRYHVVAYDVRGAGESSKPRGPAAYDYERLGDDLAVVIEALAPDGRAHLVGHDWGAIQSWDFVADERFGGTLLSFTAIAGPSLDHLSLGIRELLRRPTPGGVAELVGRVRRSWYVLALLTPGVPTALWRGPLAGGRWDLLLEYFERIPGARDQLAPTLASDAIHGAKLYRRNIPRRLLRPRRDPSVRVPVQLILPHRDHWISSSYYELAERFAPSLRRRTIAATHWVPRTQPLRLARWIGEFVDGVEAGMPPKAATPWVPGGGLEQLGGRLALVTGAASGIGLATARALAERGARLLLVDRDADTLERAASSIAHSHAFVCDVSDEQAMQRLANRVLGEHDVPDVVVNNAGIGVAGPFVETELADLNRIVGINLLGVIYGCRLFGRAMVERGDGGQIVNTASMAAFTPSKDLAAYAATKAAVLMLSESLRAELGEHGIGVTAVCPGFIATGIMRATRYVGVDEGQRGRVAERVARLYEWRNFTPERVAREIVRAIGADLPVAVVTPEAKLMHALSRFAPAVLRRVAKLDTVPV